MLERFKGKNPMDELGSVATGADINAIQDLVEKIHVHNDINRFILTVTRQTREHADVLLGASPRASICLFKASQAWALFNGRDYVIPDDVVEMAPHVLSHRILMRQEASIKKVTVKDVLEKAVKQATGAITR